jgi:hypothetical protein
MTLSRPIGKHGRSGKTGARPQRVPGSKGDPIQKPIHVALRLGAFDPSRQDHLFISYAWENCGLADWLVRQLTAHGYRVWCDRFQMLGGEPFPQVIDEAIKTRTFRLVALLSRHSLQKPSPRKERTLALSLSREWGIDFMIPLNVDGLKPSQLPWDYSDLTYISFEDWAAGLDQLLRALVKASAPRPLPEDEGRRFAADTFLPQHVIENRKETLYTNCFAFERIPERLHLIKWQDEGPRPDLDRLPVVWPYYSFPGDRVVAFSPPPPEIPHSCYTVAQEVLWRKVDIYEGVPSRDIVSNLLWQSVVFTLVRRGLSRDTEKGLFYFPRGLIRKNKIRYVGRRGRKTWVSVVGEKRFRGKPYRYCLAPDFRIRQDLGQDFVSQLKIRVFLTDIRGKRLDHPSTIARRKHLVSTWFNHHWLNRVLAIASYLGRSKSRIVLLDGDDPVILFAAPISGEVNCAINEASLKSLREEVAARTTGWEDDEGEPEEYS